MFENEAIQGIHKSRYVASWGKVGGKLDRKGTDEFTEWLYSLGFLTGEEVSDIVVFATIGRLELQDSARKFLHEKHHIL